MMRFWQGYTISYFAVKYFAIYKKQDLYSIMNAVSVLFGGFSSNLIAGYISDKYEPVNYKTKGYVAMVMSILGVPVCAACFLVHNNFWFSMTFLFLEYLLCEGWMSPSVSMIQQVVDVRYKGVAIGVFLFATTLAGTLAATVIGEVVTATKDDPNDPDDPATIGVIMAISTGVPCIFATIFFYIAAQRYEEIRIEQEAKKEDAIVKASVYDVEFKSRAGSSTSIYGALKENLTFKKPPTHPYYSQTREKSNTEMVFKRKRPITTTLPQVEEEPIHES